MTSLKSIIIFSSIACVFASYAGEQETRVANPRLLAQMVTACGIPKHAYVGGVSTTRLSTNVSAIVILTEDGTLTIGMNPAYATHNKQCQWRKYFYCDYCDQIQETREKARAAVPAQVVHTLIYTTNENLPLNNT